LDAIEITGAVAFINPTGGVLEVVADATTALNRRSG
jgi:hypothetical protein